MKHSVILLEAAVAAMPTHPTSLDLINVSPEYPLSCPSHTLKFAPPRPPPEQDVHPCLEHSVMLLVLQQCPHTLPPMTPILASPNAHEISLPHNNYTLGLSPKPYLSRIHIPAMRNSIISLLLLLTSRLLYSARSGADTAPAIVDRNIKPMAAACVWGGKGGVGWH